jgi:hypothetical protein
VKDQPSIRVDAGLAYEPIFVDTRELHVICATEGAAFTCKEGSDVKRPEPTPTPTPSPTPSGS